MRTRMLRGLAAGLLVLGGCSGGGERAAEGPDVDATGEEPPGPPALDAGFGQGGIRAMPLSPTGHDRFLAVAPGTDGISYAAGFTSVGDDHAMVLARVLPDGALDPTFGEAGVATVNVVPGGGTVEVARAVVVQPDGKVVVSGPVEHDPEATGPAARDTDVALARFGPTGRPDPSFGEQGVAVVDLGTGHAVGSDGYVGDSAWGLLSLPDDRLVVFGSTPARGRDDVDFALVGLTGEGEVDPSFGAEGRLVVDLDGSADSPRNVALQRDGKIVATGYSRDAAGVVSPVLIRASADGELDPSFGTGGVASAPVLPGGVAESYQVGLQGDDYVLAGYGRGADSAEKVDLVSVRFTGEGQWDRTYGTDGLVRLDVAALDDRGRNLVVLPDGRVLVTGVGTPLADSSDAMLALLDRDGAPVPAFGTDGRLLSDLGGPADAWFGAALSADGRSVVIVGHKGTSESSGGNDDAVMARLAL